MSLWHLDVIPKIAHFFWDDRPMSFLRWMTLHSFSTLNPDWKLRLHVGAAAQSATWATAHNKQTSSEDYRDRLDQVLRLEIVQEDRLAHLHGVQQSDILRNRYLVEEGGLWSDMDIVYFGPMSDLGCNLMESSGSAGICQDGGWFPIGFMMGAPGSEFFRDVLDHQMSSSLGGSRAYQGFGTGVYKSVLTTRSYDTFSIGTHEVYQHRWAAHERIFNGQTRINTGIGIHWYGGSQSAAIHEPNLRHDNWHDHPMATVIGVTL